MSSGIPRAMVAQTSSSGTRESLLGDRTLVDARHCLDIYVGDPQHLAVVVLLCRRVHTS